MTIIVSTHRLSLLGLVDRLLLFEKGKLVADGPRDAVLARLRGTPAKPANVPGMPPAAGGRSDASL
jgi:ATP-binding cassette subfamily C protein LapB